MIVEDLYSQNEREFKKTAKRFSGESALETQEARGTAAPRKKISGLSGLLLLFLLIGNAMLFLQFVNLNQKYHNLSGDISALRYETTDFRQLISQAGGDMVRVNFHEPGVQDFPYGFKIAYSEVKDGDGGLLVSGKVINPHSVSFTKLDFRLTVDSVEKTFNVEELPAGSSAAFSLQVNELSAEQLKSVWVEVPSFFMQWK
jgi:hypothetical protein